MVCIERNNNKCDSWLLRSSWIYYVYEYTFTTALLTVFVHSFQNRKKSVHFNVYRFMFKCISHEFFLHFLPHELLHAYDSRANVIFLHYNWRNLRTKTFERTFFNQITFFVLKFNKIRMNADKWSDYCEKRSFELECFMWIVKTEPNGNMNVTLTKSA